MPGKPGVKVGIPKGRTGRVFGTLPVGEPVVDEVELEEIAPEVDSSAAAAVVDSIPQPIPLGDAPTGSDVVRDVVDAAGSGHDAAPTELASETPGTPAVAEVHSDA